MNTKFFRRSCSTCKITETTRLPTNKWESIHSSLKQKIHTFSISFSQEKPSPAKKINPKLSPSFIQDLRNQINTLRAKKTERKDFSLKNLKEINYHGKETQTQESSPERPISKPSLEMLKISERIKNSIATEGNYTKLDDQSIEKLKQNIGRSFTELIQMFEKKIILLENEKQLLHSIKNSYKDNTSRFFSSLAFENPSELSDLICEGSIPQALFLYNSSSSSSTSSLLSFLHCNSKALEEFFR
jgi:hypothetical protein